MKKIFLFLILVSAFFFACRKEETHLLDKSPDQRLNDTIAAYQAKLSGAQFGWKGLVRPKGGGTYTFYFKFNDANRVQMLSGFDSISAVTLKESSYRLKALQQPSLVFDTYSYLHVLSDPDPGVNGGNVGTGLQSDFEFYFAPSSVDTINLVGRINGSTTTLIRATQAEATAFTSGQLASGLLLNKIQTYYKKLTVGSTTVDLNVDPFSLMVKWTDNTGNLLDSSKMSEFYLGLGSIDLKNPIIIGNQIISRISNISLPAGSQTISCTVNNAAATISPVVTPLKVDVNASRRWWQFPVNNGGRYWVALEGFHVNGVDDAYNIASIPNYEDFIVFWPRRGTNAGVTFDLLSPITNAAIEFGAAYRPPTFTANGRIIFPFYGTLGTVPPTANAAYIGMRNQMAEPNGYYLIQTSDVSYDMVGAADGKAWISWIWVF